MRQRERVPHALGLTELASQLAGDAREVARAEAGLVKARALSAVARYKAAVILFAVAGVLALAGFIALLVGLIATLATLVGPGWATAIVCGAVFATAGIIALIGKNRLSPPAAKQ